MEVVKGRMWLHFKLEVKGLQGTKFTSITDFSNFLESWDYTTTEGKKNSCLKKVITNLKQKYSKDQKHDTNTLQALTNKMETGMKTFPNRIKHKSHKTTNHL